MTAWLLLVGFFVVLAVLVQFGPLGLGVIAVLLAAYVLTVSLLARRVSS